MARTIGNVLVWLAPPVIINSITIHTWAQSQPATAPDDGGAIVFASDRDGDFEIYRMNANGEHVAQLTKNSALDTAPSCSPDGTQIAFVSDRDGAGALYVMNADGTSPGKIADDAKEPARLAWSPDGKRIAFDRQAGDKLSIIVINSEGRNEQPMIDDAMMPAWSPDGNRIIFNRGQLPALYSMNVDGTDIQPLLKDNPNGPLPDLSAIWAPDGKSIAYTAVKGVVKDERGQDQMDYEIRIVNADGTSDRSVLTVHGLAVCWSADGARIVYSSGTRHNVDLFIVNLDGTGTKQLTSGPGKEPWASWLPRSQ
jgi:TolB protein